MRLRWNWWMDEILTTTLETLGCSPTEGKYRIPVSWKLPVKTKDCWVPWSRSYSWAWPRPYRGSPWSRPSATRRGWTCWRERGRNWQPSKKWRCMPRCRRPMGPWNWILLVSASPVSWSWCWCRDSWRVCWSRWLSLWLRRSSEGPLRDRLSDLEFNFFHYVSCFIFISNIYCVLSWFTLM